MGQGRVKARISTRQPAVPASAVRPEKSVPSIREQKGSDGMKKPLQLEYSESYLSATTEERAIVCNGVGPASWPDEVRNVLNSAWLTLGISFKLAADMHDWDYAVGRTEADKIAADKRFRRNCRAMVWYYTPLWRWRLLLKRLALGKSLYLAVKYGGGPAFWAGKEKPDACPDHC